MTPLRAILFGLAAALLVWVALNFSNKSPFHEPMTPAEKALDATLKKTGNDDYLFENARLRPGRVPAKHRMDYTKMLTTRLLSTLADQEQQLSSQNCGPDYLAVKDEICGLDYNPITCAQDVDEVYYYHTLSGDANGAVIDYSWPNEQNKTVAHYELIHEAGGWKIDSVRCVFD